MPVPGGPKPIKILTIDPITGNKTGAMTVTYTNPPAPLTSLVYPSLNSNSLNPCIVDYSEVGNILPVTNGFIFTNEIIMMTVAGSQLWRYYGGDNNSPEYRDVSVLAKASGDSVLTRFDKHTGTIETYYDWKSSSSYASYHANLLLPFFSGGHSAGSAGTDHPGDSQVWWDTQIPLMQGMVGSKPTSIYKETAVVQGLQLLSASSGAVISERQVSGIASSRTSSIIGPNRSRPSLRFATKIVTWDIHIQGDNRDPVVAAVLYPDLARDFGLTPNEEAIMRFSTGRNFTGPGDPGSLFEYNYEFIAYDETPDRIPNFSGLLMGSDVPRFGMAAGHITLRWAVLIGTKGTYDSTANSMPGSLGNIATDNVHLVIQDLDQNFDYSTNPPTAGTFNVTCFSAADLSTNWITSLPLSTGLYTVSSNGFIANGHYIFVQQTLDINYTLQATTVYSIDLKTGTFVTFQPSLLGQPQYIILANAKLYYDGGSGIIQVT